MNKITSRIRIGSVGFYAAKIGIGTTLAIFIAMFMKLEYASSAGIITLLSIVPTKMDTWRLCLDRIITFIATVVLAWVALFITDHNWIAFGIVLTIVTFGLAINNLQATLSVNAVFLTHMMSAKQLTWQSIWNEFWLLIIGIVIAIIINHVQDFSAQKKRLDAGILDVEIEFKKIFAKLKNYLSSEDTDEMHVWDDVIALEEKLTPYQTMAHQYQQNRLPVKDDFYVNYFEMRLQQVNILHNLHYEIKKLRKNPHEAQIVADYLETIHTYFSDREEPKIQLEKLGQYLQQLEKEELPKTHDEFAARARMYHILMDLEDFIILKKRFIKNNRM